MLRQLFPSKNFVRFRKFSTISKLLEAGPQTSPITVQGWILHRREYKQLNFYALGDGLSSDTMQIVVDKTKSFIKELKPGVAVKMIGNLHESAGRGQKYDFLPESIDVIGEMDSENYPFGGMEKEEEGRVRRHLHLRPKMLSFSAMLRIRNAAKQWMHKYLQENHFINIDTPIFTLNDCEGGGEAFYVEPADKAKSGDIVHEVHPDGTEKEIPPYYFGRPAFTTVSGQLHLEAAACALSRVYTFNPVFRAESSISNKHLAEFYMLEVELAFIKDLEPLLELNETLFKKCANAILNEHTKDYEYCAKYHNAAHMNIVQKTLNLSKPFPRLSHKEALVILEKGVAENLFPKPVKSFTKEQEKYLVKHCGDLPVFVLDYPADSKPFYMARSKDDPDKAACFDFLAPLTGEIVGGSLRESNFDTLANCLDGLEDAREKLGWYLDLRRFGHPGTGGFGLGFERYLQWLVGARNIKDCLPFPRWYQHCFC